MRANTLVRYHGSKPALRGVVLRVLGRCHCRRHDHDDRRWLLAFRGENRAVMTCVRTQSFTRVTVAEADANPFAEYSPDLGTTV
jgi:hypothetical protein